MRVHGGTAWIARLAAGALALSAGAAQASPVWVWRNSGLVKLGENLSIAGQWSYAGAIDPGGIVYDSSAQALWLNDKGPSGNLHRIRLASPASIAKVPMDLPQAVTGGSLALFAASAPPEPSLDIETKLAAASLDSDAYEEEDTAHFWLYAGGTQRMAMLARDGRHLRTIDLAEEIPGMAHPANAFFEKPGGNGTLVVTDGTHLSALLNGHDPVAFSSGSFITQLIPEGEDYFWVADCAARKVRRSRYYYTELDISVPDYPVQCAPHADWKSVWILSLVKAPWTEYRLSRYNFGKLKWSFTPIGGLTQSYRMDVDLADGSCLVRDGDRIKRFGATGELLATSPPLPGMGPFYVQRGSVQPLLPPVSPLPAVAPLPNPAVYHVAPGGSDESGTGSQAKPWRSVAFGVSHAAIGSTLRVAAGTYEENVVVAKSLSIRGDGDDATIIKSKTEKPVMTVKGATWLSLSDLAIGSPECYGEQPLGLIAANARVRCTDVTFCWIYNVALGLADCTFELERVTLTNLGSCGLGFGMQGDLGVYLLSSSGTIADSAMGFNIDHVIDMRNDSELEMRDTVIVGSDMDWGNAVRMMDRARAEIADCDFLGWGHGLVPSGPMGYDGLGVFGAARAVVTGGLICGWAQGLALYGNGTAVVSDTEIRDNYMHGVASASYAEVGFNPDLGGGISGSPGGNSIRDNGLYDVLHRNKYPLSARQAWWGTADPSAIADGIYDHADDPSLGAVDCSARLPSAPE